MKLQIDNLGKVAITVDKDYWDINKDYDKLTIVPVKDKFATYISRKPVPAGTVLTDKTYWIPFSSLKEEIILDYNNWVSQNNENVKQYVEDVIRHNQQIIRILEDITGINIHLEDVILRVRTLETNVNTINEELNDIQDTLKTKGKPGGFAELNESGQIPSEVLPSFVDDVVEYETISDFPHPGEQGKIYIETSTNFSYRWSGSEYIQMPKNYTLPAATDTVLGGIKLGPHMRLNDDNKLLIDIASTVNDGLMKKSDKEFIEKQKLEIITYNGEEINPKTDFAVIMNDGSLYIERNIDWSTKVVQYNGKKAIALHEDRNLYSSEYAPKFSKILSLGDLSPADGICMYALWHIQLPYCYPWGEPKVLSIIKSDIPEPCNLSRDYIGYQLQQTKIPPKFKFTYNGPSNVFEFLRCDFREVEYAGDTLDYEEGDKFSVHLDLPNVELIRFYCSKFDSLVGVKCNQINSLTKYQIYMFTETEIKQFPYFEFPEGEAGNHIMDPENPTGTHIQTNLYDHWKFTNLGDANQLFTGLVYTGPDANKRIMDFSVFGFEKATGAWQCFADLRNMPHIQIWMPALTNPAYDIFKKSDKTKTLIVTEVGPNCNAVWGSLPLALEHIEMNLRNANNFGTPSDIYTAKILLLYHLKCNCNISNFPLIGDDSVERTLTYLQTVTNKTFTLNTNVYNRIIKQDKFKELIAAAEAKGWRITHATTEAADKAYNAKYDNITSRLSDVEENVSGFESSVDKLEKNIAIYPFDNITDSLSSDFHSDGTIVFLNNSGFYIKENGEWTQDSPILDKYISRGGLGGNSARIDVLYRKGNTLYTYNADAHNKWLTPFVKEDNLINYVKTNDDGKINQDVLPIANKNTLGGVKSTIDSFNTTYVTASPCVYANNNGALFIATYNTGTTTEHFNAMNNTPINIRLGAGNTNSDALRAFTEIYYYDGSRAIDEQSMNFVLETGLYNVLQSYVKTDENGKINTDVIPIDTHNSAFEYIDGTTQLHWPTSLKIVDGKLRTESYLNVYNGNRELGDYRNVVQEKGLKKVLESYPKLTDGLIPAQYLPSYVDDVLEFESLSVFPITGESGKIYVDTTENRTYRWSGTQYTEIGKSLALGETSSTAYAGDKGAANATAISDIQSTLNSLDDNYAKLTDGKVSTDAISFYTGTKNMASVQTDGNAGVFNFYKDVNGALNANISLYTYDGSRELSSTYRNLVEEKGLYSIINPINNSITTLTTDLSDLTDVVEDLSTTVDGIKPYILPKADYSNLGGVKITSTTPNLDVVGVVECTTLNADNRLCVIVKNDHTVNINTAVSTEIPLTISRDGTGGSLKFKADLNVYDGTRDGNEDSSNLVTEKGLMSIMNELAALVYSYPKDVIGDAEYMTTLISALKTNAAFKTAIKEIVQEVLNGNASTN